MVTSHAGRQGHWAVYPTHRSCCQSLQTPGGALTILAPPNFWGSQPSSATAIATEGDPE
jgi:hypothetical protein